MIDRNKLKAMLGNDDTAVERFINIFKKQIPVQLELIKHSISKMDWAQVAITAHAIKSQCSYLSLETIVEQALEIERIADEGKQLDLLPGLVASFEAALTEVIEQELG